MIRSLALISILFFSNSCYSSPPSIADYQQKENNELHDMYIYGLERGLDWSQEYMYSKYSIEFFCKPRDLVLSATQLRILIDKELNENTSFYTKYRDAPLLGLALRNAYIASFPCD
tara:strand:+ start:48 stop:395 length:348 start_codon:yes stop_codon:yes gene_type:complete